MWPLLVAVLLCPTRAVPDDDVIRNVFSAATAAAWVTVLVGMSTLFAANFMLKKKCPAVLQAERVKGKTCSWAIIRTFFSFLGCVVAFDNKAP